MAPWNIILTIVFGITLVVCLVELVQHRRAAPESKLSAGDIVHIGHAVMSIAMIAMTWSMQNQVLMWVQVVIFAGLALWLVPSLLRSQGQDRGDLISHLILHAAMIWMLAAMELLMAGMGGGMGGGDMGGHDMGGGMGEMAGTPMWANVVNWLFVLASVAVAVWWLVRWLKKPQLASACHFLMGAGMALMLVLMNG